MKNLFALLFCIVIVFVGAFCLTEFIDGSSPIYISDSTDVYKMHDMQKDEERPEFYEGEARAALLEVLSKMERKNYKTRQEAIEGDKIKYRIYLQNEKYAWFIHLGETNFVSDGLGGYSYKIVNAEEIIAKIDKLLEEQAG